MLGPHISLKKKKTHKIRNKEKVRKTKLKEVHPMETTFIVKRTVLSSASLHRVLLTAARDCYFNIEASSCRGSVQSSTVKARSCNTAEKVSPVRFTINDFIPL